MDLRKVAVARLRRNKDIWRGLLIAALLPIAASACEEQQASQRELIRPVRAIRVADTTRLSETAFPGRASAGQEVNLSFRVSGPLITRSVDLGDQVKQGAVVARIDPRDFEVVLRNTQAQLERSRSELEAMRQARPEDVRRAQANADKARAAVKLAGQELARLQNIQAQDSGAVAQVSIDRAEDKKSEADAALRNALEELRIAKIGARKEDIAAKEAEIASLAATVDAASDNLSYTYLRAPFEGIITQTYVENFETVVTKQPILRLLNPSSIEFTIFIPEGLIGYAPYVQTVTVRFDALADIEVEAKIKEIGKEASQATRTYPVTLVMDQPPGVEILPGMAGKAFVTAQLPEEAKEVGIEIPATAVFSVGDPGKSYVWVVDDTDKTLSRREVQIGQLTSFGIMVKAGLEAGEWIVVKGVHSLAEGQQVRIFGAEADSPS